MTYFPNPLFGWQHDAVGHDVTIEFPNRRRQGLGMLVILAMLVEVSRE